MTANGIKAAVFTVAIMDGMIDSIDVTDGGLGYPGTNYPSDRESAYAAGEIVENDPGYSGLEKAVITMPNMTRHVDFYLGTGADAANDNTSGE